MKAQRKDTTWTTKSGNIIGFTTRYKGLINNTFWFRENYKTVLCYNGAKITEAVDAESKRLLDDLQEVFVALNKAQVGVEDCDTQRQEKAKCLLRALSEKCNYCKGTGYHQSYEGGDWHTSSCYKCNPRSPWHKNLEAKKLTS